MPALTQPDSSAAVRSGNALRTCAARALLLFALTPMLAAQEAARTDLAGGGWIEQTMVAGPDGRPVADGPYQRFDAEGRVRVDGQMKDGERHGRWRWRDPDGKARITGNYRGGLRHGAWSFRYPGGAKRAEGSYREGIRTGAWELWEPGSSGRATRKNEFERVERADVHAKKELDGILVDGRPDGPWRFYWPDGALQLEAWFHAGRRSGTWRFFHADGTEDPAFAMLDHGEPDPFAGTWPDPPPPAEWDGPAAPAPAPRPWVALPELVPDKGAAAEQAGRLVAQIRTAAPDARPALAGELVALGDDAVLPVVNALGRLELERAEDAALAALLVRSVLVPVTGQDYGWAPGSERLAVLRWHSVASLVQAGLADRPDPPAAADPAAKSGSQPGKPGTKPAAQPEPGFRPLVLRHGRWMADRLGLFLPPEGVAGTKLEARFEPRPESARTGPSRAALDDALAWLVAHQAENGGWDCDEFAKRCGRIGQGACDGAGYAVHDVGVTGLALLALLGDANTPAEGRHHEAVLRAIAWLVAQQDKRTGQIGDRSAHDFLYNHTIAVLALSEACCVAPSPELKQTAQRAVDFLLKGRNDGGAWRYEVPPKGNNDTSITGWALIALETASEAGLKVDPDAFHDGLAWIENVTDAKTGRTGYDAPGSLSARTPANDHYPREKGEAMTAVALLARIFLGQSPQTHPVLEVQSDLLRRCLPVWDPDGFGCDMYYWYYGTYAAYQMGGATWEAWEPALRTALLESQRKDGDAKGSWDPVGPWGYVGGRLYSTALMALCLEVEFRYSRILDR